jgi:2-phosphosulfolactate phosphatase
LATIPCSAGLFPVVNEACTEQVTAGNVGVRPQTFRDAIQRPIAELPGKCSIKLRLKPGMSMTQTRLLMQSPLQRRPVIANFRWFGNGMTAQVILLPRDLKPADVTDRTVVVFDVLRATTTITAALAAGVREIRVFHTIDAARDAAASAPAKPILCGEINCLPPPGFDMGNSPRQWDSSIHKGSTVYLATTNGSRAIVSASVHRPVHLLVAAVVNARAAAAAIRKIGLDVTLLCSGTNGAYSMEDILGAGAVLDALAEGGSLELSGDGAQIAKCLFSACRDQLPKVFRSAGGGLNLIRANLEADIDFCAGLNRLSIVGQTHLLDAPSALTIIPFPYLEAK